MPSSDESEAAKALRNTGKVLADQSIGITYGGKVLHSRQEAWWKVRVWDKDSTRTAARFFRSTSRRLRRALHAQPSFSAAAGEHFRSTALFAIRVSKYATR